MSASLLGLLALLGAASPANYDDIATPPTSPVAFEETSVTIERLDIVMQYWNWEETHRVLEQIMSPNSVQRYHTDLDFAKSIWNDMARELRLRLAQNVRERLTRQQLHLIGSAMTDTISRVLVPADSSEAPKEGLLYRYWSPGSQSRFDDVLGVCCSLWQDPKDVFRQPLVIDKFTMTNHMNGSHTPSPFVSLASSPGYLLNNIGNRYKHHEHDGRVIIYNFQELQEDSSWPIRSTDLANAVGIRKTEWSKVYKPKYEAKGTRSKKQSDNENTLSVEYISRFHWLAVGRLRNECIRNVVSLDTFREVCKSQSIVLHSWNRREIPAGIWDNIQGRFEQ